MSSKSLSLPEVAEQLGFHIDTLRGYCRRGLLPAFKIGGEWRVREDSLDDFIAALEQQRNGREVPA